jgi:saccharopine dehydrogenase-like NADP-dependent oxidoreductase
MGYAYVIFGAGRQGTAAIYDLLTYCQAVRVLVVDPDAQALERASERLSRIGVQHEEAVTFARSAGASDLRAMDVVLSCAPYRFNADLTRLALEAGVAFCDLGGNPDVVARQERIARENGAGLPVVPDCGVSPGLSNILAVHLAREEKADAIRVRCGGLPITESAADNPLKYKLVFDPHGLISEYSGRVPVLREGRLEYVEALSCIEPFDGGRLEASPTSNNSPQVVAYLRSLGVRQYDYMTLRYPGHWEQARAWRGRGFLCGNAEADARLAEELAADSTLRYDPERDRDRLILDVLGFAWVSGAEAGLRRYSGFHMDVTADRRTGFSAMELTTSWGGTVVAHYLAMHRGTGRVPTGFATPEQFISTEWVVDEMQRRLKDTPGGRGSHATAS